MEISPIVKNTLQNLQKNIISSGQVLQEKISMVGLAIFALFATICAIFYLSKRKVKKQSDSENQKANDTFNKTFPKDDKKPAEEVKSETKSDETLKKLDETLNKVGEITKRKLEIQLEEFQKQTQEKHELHYSDTHPPLNSSHKDDPKVNSQEKEGIKAKISEPIKEIDPATDSLIRTGSIETHFTQIGDLLLLVKAIKGFSATPGFQEYEGFIGESFTVSLEFLDSLSKLIEYHNSALNKPEEASVYLDHASIEIGTAVNTLENLMKTSKAFIDLSIKKLETLSEDPPLSNLRKQEIKDMINEVKTLACTYDKTGKPLESSDTVPERLKKVNATLEKTVKKFINLNSISDSLEIATLSLEVVIQKMTKIHITYEQTRLLWLNKQSALKNTSNSKNEEMSKNLKESQSNWKAFRKQNRKNHETLVNLNNEINQKSLDSINLIPTNEKAKVFIETFPFNKIAA